MIDVQDLYLSRQELLRKDHAGWVSGDEYNRRLSLCQKILFDYYVQLKDERAKQKALLAFTSEKNLPKVDGFWNFPTDYEEVIEIWAAESESCSPDDALYYPVDIPAADEIGFSLTSPIRGYKGNRRGAKLFPGKARIYPVAFDGYVKLNYYRTPLEPLRAFTYDEVNLIEVYDQSSSVNLEWSASEYQDFLDLLLLFDGVTLRDSSLIQWVSNRNLVEQQIIEE